MELSPQTPQAETREIRRNIFSLIIPIAVEGILQMIATTIVMGMIGRLDVYAINAWGITTRLTQVFWAFVRGISLGITIGVASDLGAQNKQRIQQTVVCALATLFALGIVFAALLAAFAPQVISLFGGDAEMNAKAVIATRISCIGLPFWTSLVCTSGILQGHGNAKVPMVIMTVYNFVVAGIGYPLIFGAFGLPRLEIRGAAWTMVISQILMCFVCLTVLSRYGFFKNLKQAGLTPAVIRVTLARIFRLGIPPAIENLLWQFGSIIMLRPILRFGDYAYAAHQLGMQAEAVSYMPTMGFGIATTSLISRSFGANDLRKAETYYKKILKYMGGITAVLMAIIFFGRIPLMGLLTNDRGIIELGAIYLITAVLSLMPHNIYGVYTGAIRGAGYNKVPMYISFVGLWLFRVPFSYIAAYLIPGANIVWIWAGMGIDLVIRFGIGFVFMRRKKIFRQRELGP